MASLLLVTPQISNAMVTIEQLRINVRETYKIEKSWRKTARRYRISKAMAWRIANDPDYEPRGRYFRRLLGLSALVEVPPCPACGGDPCYCANCATPKRKNGSGKPRNRRAVSLDNPQSAAATLRSHASAEYRKELARLLEDER